MSELQIKSLLPVESKKVLDGQIKDLANTTFVGIDFGTSNTVVSIASLSNDENFLLAKPIELNQKLPDGAIFKSYLVPSVVAWYQNKLLIGQGAAELKHKLRYGKNLWHSFKMELGEDVGCKYPNSELGKDHELIQLLNPKDVTKIFFKYLKAQIDRYIKENNLPNQTKYSVSVPASFEANQRRDLIDSMEASGFEINNQSLIDEPNAAFLGYVLRSNIEQNPIFIPEDYFPNVLVFDFGAGTCDVSILEIGKDNKGLYSKNISISRFEHLGGDNIDNLIAIDVLLPQLFEGSNLTPDDFRSRELKELIIPKLLKSAERLKIAVSETFNLQAQQRSLPEICEDAEKITLGTEIQIETSKGILSLREPYITFDQFAAVNNVFTVEKTSGSVTRIDDNEKFINIIKPVKSALRKAKLSHHDIDYILFIGGSSKNPFIRKTIAEYFPESEVLVPDDLQAHVSSGASIHSLIFNGFNKNLIQPITSEPLIIITKEGNREIIRPIVEAGTIIPSDKKMISNLTPQRDGQETIEIPICVSNKNKMLYNIQLLAPNKEGFKKSTPISLEIEINADKIVLIDASADTQKVRVEPLSPFANHELTSEERIKLKAEKEFNLDCERNGGEPTLNGLKNLYNTYRELGLHLKAAETLEQIGEMFPNERRGNEVGLHYSNAGKHKKAVQNYEAEFKKTNSDVTAFNISMEYKRAGDERWKEYLKKSYELNPSDEVHKYNYAKMIKHSDPEHSKKLMREAFDSWKKRYNSKNMDSWDYSWFSSCAEDLGEYTFAKVIRNAEPKKEIDSLYQSKNLTRIKESNDIIKY